MYTEKHNKVVLPKVVFFILIVIFFSSSVFAISDANIVSSFPFDGNANDVYGRNNWTVTGATLNSSCHSGQCYVFDGVNDYMQIESFTGFPAAGSSKSVSMWVKLANPTTYNIIWNYASNSLNRLEIRYPSAANRFEFNHRTAVSVDKIAFADSSSTQGVWHHFTWTHDGSTSRIYVNGVLQTDTDTNAQSYSGTKMGLGHWVDSSGYFNGSIDEVVIWNKTLSSAEVLDVYENGTSQPIDYSPTIGTIHWNLTNGTTDLTYGSSVLKGKILDRVNSTITFNETLSSLQANFSLKYPNGSYAVNNQIMSNVSTHYFYDTNINMSTAGTWTIEINATAFDANSTPYSSLSTKTILITNPPQIININNVVSAYHLDGNGIDEKGVNNLTITGAAVDLSCPDKSCYKFDGVDDYMSIHDFTGFPDDYQPKAVSVWVRLDTPTTYNIIWNYAAGSNANRLEFRYPSVADRFEFNHRNNNTVDVLAYANGASTRDVWHHVLYDYNGTVSKIYINNVLQTDTDTTVQDYTNTTFALGNWGEAQGGYFNGSIDEVVIFNQSLNDTERAHIYNSRQMNPYPFDGTAAYPTIGRAAPDVGTIHWNLTNGTTDLNSGNISISSILDRVNTTITFNTSVYSYMLVNFSLKYPNGSYAIENQYMTNVSTHYFYEAGFNLSIGGNYTLEINATAYDSNLSTDSTKKTTTFIVNNPYALNIEDLFESATTFDGVSIVYDVFMYTNSSNVPKTLVIYSSGWSGTRANVRSNGEPQYIAREHIVANIDVRGKGDSGGSRDVYGYSCMDAIAVADDIRAGQYGQYINNVTYLFGGSDGGGYAGTCFLKSPDYFSGSGFLAGVLNVTYWYNGYASSTYKSQMQSWIGGTPTTNREGYDSRTAVYLAENVLTPFYMYHGTGDTSVNVEVSQQLNTSIANFGFTNYIYDEDAGTHSQSANFTKYDIAYTFLNETVYNIPNNGYYVIGSFINTKNYSIFFSDMDDVGFVHYNITSSSTTLNMSTRSFIGNVNVTVKNLYNNTNYTLRVDDVYAAEYVSNNNGEISWLQSVDTSWTEMSLEVTYTQPTMISTELIQNPGYIDGVCKATNADTGVVTYIYELFQNSTSVLSGSVNDTVHNINTYVINYTSSNYSKFDNFTLACQATNSTFISTSLNDSLTVKNFEPIVSVQVNPSGANYSDTLNFSNTTSDPDGDPISFYWSWYKGGQEQVAFENVSTIPSANISYADIWYVILSADDGYNITSTQSSNVTIGDNVSPIVENASLSASSGAGVAFTIYVQAFDLYMDSVTVEIKDPNALETNFSMTNTIGTNYSRTYTPSVSGTYTFTFHAIDQSGRSSTLVSNLTYSNTASESGGGGGGGGGGSSGSSFDLNKQTCNIILNPNEFTLSSVKSIISISVLNNDVASYEPDFYFDTETSNKSITDDLFITNPINRILRNDRATFGVEFRGDITGDTEAFLVLTSDNCKDIKVPISIVYVDESNGFDLFTSDLPIKDIVETPVLIQANQEQKSFFSVGILAIILLFGWIYLLSGYISKDYKAKNVVGIVLWISLSLFLMVISTIFGVVIIRWIQLML